MQKSKITIIQYELHQHKDCYTKHITTDVLFKVNLS